MIERINQTPAPAPVSSFGARRGGPQNSGGGSCMAQADFPRETAGKNSEGFGPLAQKHPPPESHTTKSSPVWQKTAKSFEKRDPPFGKTAPIDEKLVFARHSAKFTAPYVSLSRLTAGQAIV